MAADSRLRVVLCWHMHQPQYREPLSGQYLSPWSYLHALKDYTDMAAHLENQAGAVAVVNFSPVLLEQLEDYCKQLQAFFAGTGKLCDPLLEALARPELTPAGESRLSLMRVCCQVARPRMLERFADLRQLVEFAKWMLLHPAANDYVETGFLGDLLVWCHLAWLGESVRQADQRVARLTQKAKHYSAEDRRELLQLIRELLDGILPRYRALAHAAHAELSMSPWAHPILPLLLDFNAARETHPDLTLPAVAGYPGRDARAQWHIQEARRSHAECFQKAPAGCWPSEGALSTAGLALLDQSGFKWAASGQKVLLHSLGMTTASSDVLHRPYRLAEQKTVVFFRDDELSDLIGFQYKDWSARDAVSDLMNRLGAIASDAQAGCGRVVSIVLDGENAWEHYVENGREFLTALYRALSSDARFCLTTFSRCVEDAGVPVRKLPKLVAGSWVHGDLNTWIGQADKNRAWEMLVEAHTHCETALASNRLGAEQRVRLEMQLAVCEGSDWFWWLGDDNQAQAVAEFERLYRAQLAGLYQLMGEAPPEYLKQAFNRGRAGDGGAMRQAG